jgi:hypothetical protein
MEIRTALEITPLDFRRIRQGLGFSQKRMGENIATYIHGPGSNPIPGSRVNEWEMHVRAVPDHVYIACAGILTDIWAKVRVGKCDHDAWYLDSKFAALLNPALASAISFEAEFRNRKDVEGLHIHEKAREIRKEVQNYLESLFAINITSVLKGQLLDDSSNTGFESQHQPG